MKKKSWLLILVLVAVGVGAWFFNRNFIDISKPLTIISPTPTVTEKVTDGNLDQGQLLLETNVNNALSVIGLKQTGQSKTLFSDKAETNKLKYLGTFSNPQNIVAILGSQLVNVKLDGASTYDILNKDFGAIDFALCPDQSKLAYVTFSNAERDYGFSLNIGDKSGQNSKVVVQNSESIRNLIWNDNSKLIFLEDKNNASTNIELLDLNTNKVTDLYTTNDVIYSLTYSNSKIVLSQGSSDSGVSSIIMIDSNGQNKKTIYTQKSGIAYYPTLSPDKTKIAYLLSDKVSLTPTGIIYTIDITGQNKQKLVQAIKIISWLP